MPFRSFPILLLAALVHFSVPASARTLYVNRTLPVQPTEGLTWETAFGGSQGIRSAVFAANDGDEIWVTGNVSPYASIEIEKPLSVFGGLEGNESSIHDRNMEHQLSVLGGNAPLVEIRAPAVLDGFIIDNGSNGNEVAGILVIAPTCVIRNCVITDNRAFGPHGAGVRLSTYLGIETGKGARLENCVIARNRSYRPTEFHFVSNPGLLITRGYTELINCTIADNVIENPQPNDEMTGLGVRDNSKLVAINCIFEDGIELISSLLGEPTVEITFSNVLGGWDGEGNIDEPPLFVNPNRPGLPDYHLLPNSPGIDLGTRTTVLQDLDGVTRPIDIPGVGRDDEDAFDMGAYEFAFPSTAPDPRTDINQDGFRDLDDLLLLMLDWERVSGASGN